ncbi:MAG: HAD family phosphatase [Candidatus Bathyarchaeum sp.]|nr:MAG: HAD family phosphatase [Candidatus Bathyarchaeum sp.]
MVKAVIFDWDGTLADTRGAVVQSFQRVLEEVGCVVTDEFIERRMGIGTKKTIEEALKECSIELHDEMLENLVIEKIRIQASLTKIVSLFEGAIELLEELQGRTKIALGTMSGREVVDNLLPEKRIEECFDVVVTADEISKPKPDPEVFLVSASKLGVEPKDCVVIEDSVFGVRAAKAAEMKCIAVPSGAYTKEELQEENPDLMIDALTEKEKIMCFIFSSM